MVNRASRLLRVLSQPRLGGMIEVADATLCRGAVHLRDVSLRLEAGERAVLVGASGAGKTTFLEAICGLHPIAAGQIMVGGLDVSRTPPAELSIGYVPQEGVLFGTMSVRENLAYGLRRRGIAKAAIRQRVQEVAALLGIEAMLDRRPQTLSGGEARRVALGRAIAIEPRVLLLDEPLTGLDTNTRASAIDALDAAYAATQATVIHVSHDPRDRPCNGATAGVRQLRIESGRLFDEGNSEPIESETLMPPKDWRKGNPLQAGRCAHPGSASEQQSAP